MQMQIIVFLEKKKEKKKSQVLLISRPGESLIGAKEIFFKKDKRCGNKEGEKR